MLSYLTRRRCAQLAARARRRGDWDLEELALAHLTYLESRRAYWRARKSR